MILVAILTENCTKLINLICYHYTDAIRGFHRATLPRVRSREMSNTYDMIMGCVTVSFLVFSGSRSTCSTPEFLTSLRVVVPIPPQIHAKRRTPGRPILLQAVSSRRTGGSHTEQSAFLSVYGTARHMHQHSLVQDIITSSTYRHSVLANQRDRVLRGFGPGSCHDQDHVTALTIPVPVDG